MLLNLNLSLFPLGIWSLKFETWNFLNTQFYSVLSIFEYDLLINSNSYLHKLTKYFSFFNTE